MQPGPCEKPEPLPLQEARPARLSPREYRLLMTAAITGSTIAFVEGSIVSVAIPSIRDGLSASLQQMQWIVNGYALLLAAFILPGGSAGDVFGRKRVFMSGVAVYTVASLWCGLARSAPELIAGRILEGFGGALMIPASLALITVNVPRAERGAAIGLWAAAGAASSAVGPVVGGALIDQFGWRSAFFIVVPFGIVTYLVAWKGVPESRGEKRRMDWMGGMLGCLALGLAGYALTRAVETFDVWAGSALCGAIVLTALFLVSQYRSAEPMMPLHLFRVPAFAGANALTFLVYGGLAAVFFFLPITLIDAHGYSATAAGLALLPFTLAISVFSRYAGALGDRTGPRLPLTAGSIVTGIGFALLAPVAMTGNFWLHVMPVMLILGIGMGLVAAPVSTAVMNALSEEHAGVASGINNAISRAAGLVFVAGFGIVAQAGYAMSGANGRFGEPDTAGTGYGDGIISGFVAVALLTGLSTVAAAVIAYVSLKQAAAPAVSPD